MSEHGIHDHQQLSHASGQSHFGRFGVGAQGELLVEAAKSYSGGLFWSTGLCSNQKALIQRMVTVPDGMPFDQQVNLGEQSRAEGEALSRLPAAPQIVQQGGNASTAQAECASLANQAASYDSMARQPQSAAMQDWITGQKRAVRSRQVSLRC